MHKKQSLYSAVQLFFFNMHKGFEFRTSHVSLCGITHQHAGQIKYIFFLQEVRSCHFSFVDLYMLYKKIIIRLLQSLYPGYRELSAQLLAY